MVQLKRPRPEFNLGPVPDQTTLAFPRLEIPEPLDRAGEDDHGVGSLKRYKTSHSPLPQGLTSNKFQISPLKYDPLEEPSPLGLQLRKSSSFLDLIEMRLCQSNKASQGALLSGVPNMMNKKDFYITDVPSCGSLKRFPKSGRKKNAPAPKASNIPASLLKIGGWKYEPRNESNLIAKCYFAKQKLVWEVLHCDLKKKIEVQWSDIISLKAKCPPKGPGSLTIVLGRKPLFFTETNPQPRRHILWQPTADFTGGEASIHRMHCLQFSQGVLDKHYEKLIQCDSRLNLLSQQPDTDLHSPLFVSETFPLKDSDEQRHHAFHRVETGKCSPVASIHDTPYEDFSKEARSPISGIGESEAVIFHGHINWGPLEKRGFPASELSNHASRPGQGVLDQETDGNQTLLEEPSENMLKLREITEILLGDTHMMEASDEISLMKRVNSLCSLLQDPETMTAQKSNLESLFNEAQMTEDNSGEKSFMSRVNSLRCLLRDPEKLAMPENKDPENAFSSKKVQTMVRKYSLADLLVGLPSLASLTNFHV